MSSGSVWSFVTWAIAAWEDHLEQSLSSQGSCLSRDAAAYIPWHQHTHAVKQQGIKVLWKLAKAGKMAKSCEEEKALNCAVTEARSPPSQRKGVLELSDEGDRHAVVHSSTRQAALPCSSHPVVSRAASLSHFKSEIWLDLKNNQ